MSLKLPEAYPTSIGSDYSINSHSGTASDTDSLEQMGDSNHVTDKITNASHTNITDDCDMNEEKETLNKSDDTLQTHIMEVANRNIQHDTEVRKQHDATMNGISDDKDPDSDTIQTMSVDNVGAKEQLIPTVVTSKLIRIPKSLTFDSSVLYHAHIKPHNCLNVDPIKQANKPRAMPFITSPECILKQPRATISSKLRAEKQKEKQEQHLWSSQQQVNGEEYQTPSQRKDLLIRDLRRQVRELTTSVEEKDHDIALYKQNMDEETYQLVQEKDDTIIRLREELRDLKQSYDDLSAFCEESITTASAIEKRAETLKKELSERDKQQQKIYLEMYRKGQSSATFEREEELERLASAGGCTVTISELVKKLALTELELAKWQTIRTQESYTEGPQPETESDATLRFLKDSFFHYITDTRDADLHLRAIIKIFRYTTPQMDKIKTSKLISRMDKKQKRKPTHK